MKARIYLSGPIFSQAEIEWAAKARAFLEERFGERVEVIWPHEIACGTSGEIFASNLSALQDCGLMIAVLEGAQVDDGTAWEIGYFYARGGPILGIRTDFRKAGERSDSRVNAMIEQSCSSIARDLEELASDMEKVLP
ncbi:MAG: nucleoside 2-deoxyribosyltransferase [Methanotrichaceae archaeon]|nr:nucleoside 2-deoxyribosyltransferase [Methanotrichaceae archaeon]